MTHFIIERRMAGGKTVDQSRGGRSTFAMEKEEGMKTSQFGMHAINSEGLTEPLEKEGGFSGEPVSQLVLIRFHSRFCPLPPC